MKPKHLFSPVKPDMNSNSRWHRAFFFLHRWLSLSLILEACAFLWKISASGYGFAIEELLPFAIFMPWLGVRFLFSYGTDGTPERRRSWFPWFLLLYGVFLAGSWYLDIHIFYLMRHQLWGLGLFVGKIAIVCFFAAMLLRFPRASCSPPGERPISPLGQAVIWFGLLLCLLFRVFSTMDPLVSLLVSCAEFGLFLYASWDVTYLSPK